MTTRQREGAEPPEALEMRRTSDLRPTRRVVTTSSSPRDGGRLAAVPRLALTPTEAAAALGMGLTSFKKYVQPHVRIIRRGKLRVIPVSELQRWAEENAEDLFDGRPRDRFSDSGRL
jgi:hypothetical protein